jgi:hypothetical protein
MFLQEGGGEEVGNWSLRLRRLLVSGQTLPAYFAVSVGRDEGAHDHVLAWLEHGFSTATAC